MKPVVLVLLSIVFFSACEEVPPVIDYSLPYKTKDTTYIVNPVPSAQHKAVLIEDITGVRCNNCPSAALKAKEITDLKSEDSVVVMALYTNHLPNLTTPWPGFPTLNSAYSTNIVDFNGVPSAIPCGYVDRAIFSPLTDRVTPYSSWLNFVNTRLTKSTPVNIDLKSSFGGNKAELTMKLTFTSNVADNLKYSLFLIEDGVVSKQRTLVKDDDSYTHNHILRFAFGNATGNAIIEDLVSGRVIQKIFDYEFKGDYNPDKCKIVCVITNATTYEVVNVRQIHIK